MKETCSRSVPLSITEVAMCRRDLYEQATPTGFNTKTCGA